MIIYINGLPWALELTELMTDFGECDVNYRQIKIKKNQRPEQLAITLFHELIHAIWYCYDLDDHTPGNLEETAATRLGEALGAIFHDERNAETLKQFFDV